MNRKITKDDLRKIPQGESRTWTMESPQKCVSLRSMASSLNTFEGMSLSTSIDAKTATITVTNNATEEEA